MTGVFGCLEPKGFEVIERSEIVACEFAELAVSEIEVTETSEFVECVGLE